MFPFTMTLDFDHTRHSLVTLNVTATQIKKAKDWDEFEIFYKIDRVGTPKVHTLKLGQDAGAIYGEDKLWAHCSGSGPVLYGLVIAAVDESGFVVPVTIGQQIRATARACPHG